MRCNLGNKAEKDIENMVNNNFNSEIDGETVVEVLYEDEYYVFGMFKDEVVNSKGVNVEQINVLVYVKQVFDKSFAINKTVEIPKNLIISITEELKVVKLNFLFSVVLNILMFLSILALLF